MVPKLTLESPDDFLIYREGSGGTVEIFDIVVNSERGEGRGTRLVNMLIDKTDTHLIFAITRPENRIAREFYMGTGFVYVAQLPMFYADGNGMMYGRHLR